MTLKRASTLRKIAGLAADELTVATSSPTRSKLEILIQRLRTDASTIDDWIQESSSEIFNRKENEFYRQRVVVVVLYSTLIAAVFGVLAVFFLPAVQNINDNTESVVAMLAFLPEDVRMNVSRIHSFFNGSIDDESKKTREESERLLQNILPPAISRRLKSGESPIADDHTSVTVMFSTLLGFSDFAKGMPQRQISMTQNNLTATFDDITDQLELEKIKTIGEVYFLAGGLTKKTEKDHALRCMECALNFMEAVAEFNNRNAASLQLRIGLMTGAAVAGVIGTTKIAYDLWGDTVNTASRMQSTGIAGRINVHEKVYEQVKDYFAFDTNEVTAKGKGKLTTYVFTARKGQPSPYAGAINWRKTMQ